MKNLLSAAFAVFFMSFAAFAQEAPVPKSKPPVCSTIDDVLAKMGNEGKPMPWRRITNPRYPGITVLAYVDGSAVAVKTDKNGCIIDSKIFFDPSLIKPKETGA